MATSGGCDTRENRFESSVIARHAALALIDPISPAHRPLPPLLLTLGLSGGAVLPLVLNVLVHE